MILNCLLDVSDSHKLASLNPHFDKYNTAPYYVPSLYKPVKKLNYAFCLFFNSYPYMDRHEKSL